MKIIIATPLFPPEIEDIAIYTKNLAEHLKEKYQVQILAYAGQVEDISGVEIFTVNKRQPLFLRILKYFIQLYKLAKKADLIYVQNSASTILPFMLVKKLVKKPVVLNFIEDEAWKRARQMHLTEKTWEKFLEKPEADKKISQILNLQKEALRQADKIICSSQSLAQAISKSYHISDNRLMVNYPVATPAIVLPFDSVINKNQILVFGQDFDLKYSEWDSDYKLIFIAKQSISKAELSYLIDSSALIVYNVQSENFDNFLINCFCANKNILAHQTSYAKEILDQSGALVDFSDHLAVVEKIRELVSSQKENKNNQNRFDWQNHLSKLQEIFQTSISK